MRKLILATASARRREIFARSGIPFEVEVSGFEEDENIQLPPRELVAHFALQKAHAVATRHPDALVIGADTIVALDSGEVFGKPGARARAREMLKKLSGTTHSIFTGVALVDAVSAEHSERVEETRVTFRTLSETEIEKYVGSGEGLDKAGGYALQSTNFALGTRTIEEMDNGMGLPLLALLEELGKFGIERQN